MNKNCTLYIVRHGQTDWNAKRIIQGHTNSHLTELGIEQAKKRAESLKHVKFDAVYSSDLIRAKHTAEIIALEHDLVVATKEALREQSFGSFEGKPFESIHKLFDKFTELTNEQKFTFEAHPDIETNEHTVSRFITFLREVAIGHAGKNVLIVTHGGVMRYFLLKVGFSTFEHLWEDHIKNTAMVVIESDGVDFFLKEVDGIEKKT